jgi:type I restriction enzyme S subunit
MPIQASHRTINRKVTKPQLRFINSKDCWKEYKFGNLFEFKSTNSLSREDLNYEYGIVKNIHYGDIHTSFRSRFDVTQEKVPFINTDNSLNLKENNYCEVGDLIIADASEDYLDIGKAIEITNLNNERVLAGLHTIIARPVDKGLFASGFLSYLMKTITVRKQIMILSQGTKVLSISPKYFSEIFFKVPNIEEQKQIVALLSSVEIEIEALKIQRSNLEKYKKGLLRKIFSQEVRFKDENGTAFPAWEVTTLDKVFKKKSQRNKDNKCKDVLTNSAVRGVVNQRDYFEKDIANQENLLNYYVVDLDDFVYNPRISNSAPVGPLKRNKSGRGIMSPLYTILTLNKGNLGFYECYFDTSFWHRYMYMISNFGARHDRMNIRDIDLMKMPLPFPVEKEQEKIAQFIKSIDELIKVKTMQVEKAENWKKGLLQKMFV